MRNPDEIIYPTITDGAQLDAALRLLRSHYNHVMLAAAHLGVDVDPELIPMQRMDVKTTHVNHIANWRLTTRLED